MKAMFYFRSSGKCTGTTRLQDENLPYVGDTVVLRDGSYRVTDVLLEPIDEESEIAEIEITSTPVVRSRVS